MRREETVDYHIKAAWHAIARMYNQQAIKNDFTMSMGFVLLNINSEEGVPATKIAPLMGLEARSLTRLLKSMEEKGFIYRIGDASDKRLVRIA
ncbi:MarR family winged helix-turn-helix transcriptional regulator, partial [Chryseosolibacter indicus]